MAYNDVKNGVMLWDRNVIISGNFRGLSLKSLIIKGFMTFTNYEFSFSYRLKAYLFLSVIVIIANPK